MDAAILGRARREVELPEDRADVRLDRLRRHVQLGRDPAVGSPLGEQGQHLELAPGQLGQIRERALLAQRPAG